MIVQRTFTTRKEDVPYEDVVGYYWLGAIPLYTKKNRSTHFTSGYTQTTYSILGVPVYIRKIDY